MFKESFLEYQSVEDYTEITTKNPSFPRHEPDSIWKPVNRYLSVSSYQGSGRVKL